MLNLSDNHVEHADYLNDYDSLQKVQDRSNPKRRLRSLFIGLGIFIALLFVPWTQNVRAPGKVTTLYPGQRPQTVQNVIPGRIDQWYVREGEFVKKGDTILRITEIQDAYFDPALIERTKKQIVARSGAMDNYGEKSEALQDQIEALINNKQNRLEQAENTLRQTRFRVISDSMEVVAAKVNFDIAMERNERMKELYKQGLKSLTDLETRQLTLQQTQARLVSVENRLLASRNEYFNAVIELSGVENDFAEKLGKARSEQNSARSAYFETEAGVTGLENQLSNIEMRIGNYYITAPQPGYVTQAISEGIGENIPAGTRIVSIMPANYDLAAEMFIEPVDFPLLRKGTTVRLIFDGWPAIVFSGWPQLSNGTFGGQIIAIDNFISPNGKYRILVVPDPDEIPWPEDLRFGSGSDGIMLFKDVPVWYEVWRQLNGFPPDYYHNLEKKKEIAE
ncbi:MAG: HlyD family secretion protein [Cryomorphaceae bacterium]|nr:HlyD family secretion protein [Flavobacteriales bacterium]